MMFGYNLYGLKVNSQVELARYNIRTSYKKPDVTVKLGKIKSPEEGHSDTIYKPFTVFNKDKYYQEIPTIANYLINGKDEVIIDPNPIQKNKVVTLFFIDSILPILLIKNGLFPVFASAVKTEKGIYLFTAPRGEGKSTLAANLALKGFSFIADDLCVLRWNKTKKYFETKCHHPYSYLWRSSFSIFGKNFNQVLKTKYKTQQIRNGILKFAINFNKHACKSYQEVKGIGLINVANEDIPMAIDPLKGISKLNTSKNVIHSNETAKVIMKHKELFMFSGEIAKKLDFFKITRSRLNSAQDVAQYIVDEIFTKTTD